MQTLRRQRIQKFTEIIRASDIHHYALMQLEEKKDELEQMVKDLAEALADAAESRGERVREPDMVDFELSKLPAMTLRQAIHEYFRLNTNWETKTARQWMEWAVETGITAEQIARAADTWRNDKQFNWQVPTLKGIFEKWDMLMDAVKSTEPQTPTGKGFYV